MKWVVVNYETDNEVWSFTDAPETWSWLDLGKKLAIGFFFNWVKR